MVEMYLLPCIFKHLNPVKRHKWPLKSINNVAAWYFLMYIFLLERKKGYFRVTFWSRITENRNFLKKQKIGFALD